MMQKEVIKFLLVPRRVNGRWHWLKKAKLLLKYDRTLTTLDAQTGDEMIIGRQWDIISISEPNAGLEPARKEG